MNAAPLRPVLTITIATILTAGGLRLEAAAPVEVQLRDGRVITAAIDRRTDDTRLWLRLGTESTVLLRAISWEHVSTVRRGERALSQNQLRELAVSETGSPLTKSASPRLSAPPVDRLAGRRSMAQRALLALGFGDRVDSLEFDASLKD